MEIIFQKNINSTDFIEYFNKLSININEIRNNDLYKFKHKDHTSTININTNLLTNYIINNIDIPCLNEIDKLIRINLDLTFIDIDIPNIQDWIKEKEITCLNKLSYYNYKKIDITDSIKYDLLEKKFILNANHENKILYYNGACIIDNIQFQLKNLINNIPKQQNNIKINENLKTTDKTLIVISKRIQKSIKKSFRKGLILSNKNNNNFMTCENEVIIVTYNFLNEIIKNNNSEILQYYWNKIIFINYNTILTPKYENIYKNILRLKSRFNWIIITNDPTINELQKITKHLFKMSIVNNDVLNLLFRKINYNIDKSNIETIDLEYTPKEQIILKTPLFKKTHNTMKCQLEKSYPLLFGDISIKFNKFDCINSIKKEIIKRIQKKTQLIENKINLIESKKNISESDINSLKDKIKIMKNKIQYFQELFKNICDDKENDLGSCPICYSDIKSDSVCITKCGHVFCYYCIVKSIIISAENSIDCPKCREKLFLYPSSGFYVINDEDNDECQYGRRITYIIQKMQQNFQEKKRTVILSKWGHLLKHIQNILKNKNINLSGTRILSYKNIDQLHRNYDECYFLDDPKNGVELNKVHYFCNNIFKLNVYE